jgi:calcineurin-like phosphoesterase family protein
MSKILVVGDQHHRADLPYGSSLPDGRWGEWNAVISTIHKEAKDCNAVVLLGDNLNSRNNTSEVLRRFVEFLNGFGDKEVHILVGNHERSGKSTALDFLKKIDHKNWTVYTQPSTINIGGVDAMMIPYMTPGSMGLETKEEVMEAIIKMLPKKKMRLAFVHHAITNSRVNGMEMDIQRDFFNEFVLSKEVMLKHFEQTFGGHVHEGQVLCPGIIVAGSIFTHTVGEHEKSIWKYEDGKIGEIKLPVRGIHKIVWEERDAKEAIPSDSIVKCYVTNRETNLEDVKEFLSFFDASIIIEQYPSERTKTHFESGALDLSMDGLLKLFAESREYSYSDLKDGFDSINI